jgi:hypothetical protein
MRLRGAVVLAVLLVIASGLPSIASSRSVRPGRRVTTAGARKSSVALVTPAREQTGAGEELSPKASSSSSRGGMALSSDPTISVEATAAGAQVSPRRVASRATPVLMPLTRWR